MHDNDLSSRSRLGSRPGLMKWLVVLVVLSAIERAEATKCPPIAFLNGFSTGFVQVEFAGDPTEAGPFVGCPSPFAFNLSANLCPLSGELRVIPEHCILAALSLQIQDDSGSIQLTPPAGVTFGVPSASSDPFAVFGLQAAPFIPFFHRASELGCPVTIVPYMWPVMLDGSFVSAFRAAVESLFNSSGGVPVSVVGLSEGSLATNFALQWLGDQWTERYVSKFLLAANCASGGQASGLAFLVSPQDYCTPGEPYAKPNGPWYNATQYWSGNWQFLPDPEVYQDQVLLSSPTASYTAAQWADIVTAAAPSPSVASAKITLIKQFLSSYRFDQGPPFSVPVIALVGTNFSTRYAASYPSSTLDARPSFSHQIGDTDQDLFGALSVSRWAPRSNVSIVVRHTTELGWFAEPSLVSLVFQLITSFV